ncbi:hypothetical protein BTVI_110168 [Pitangus sulphuratus]|nr:hypothetical protein BTVI_110168 [Pitangus sulphuratus]
MEEGLQSCPDEKDPGVLFDSWLNISQACALVTKKTNVMLPCTRNSVASRTTAVTVPLYLVCGREFHLGVRGNISDTVIRDLVDSIAPTFDSCLLVTCSFPKRKQFEICNDFKVMLEKEIITVKLSSTHSKTLDAVEAAKLSFFGGNFLDSQAIYPWFEMNDNEKKKVKGGKSSCFPSRVLHIRQISSNVSGSEVIALGLPFGKVTNFLMLKGKGQAFLEMASIEAAVSMVNYYALSTPHLHNQPVYIQYSNYKELKTENQHNQAGPQAALQGVNTVQHGSVAITSALGGEGGLLPGQGSVLRIIVENVFYTITLEMLYQCPTPGMFLYSARSVRSELEELKALSQSQRFDITGIRETWWDEPCDWNALLNGYRLFRRDRQGRRGRGVALCVPEGLGCVELTVGNGTVEILTSGGFWLASNDWEHHTAGAASARRFLKNLDDSFMEQVLRQLTWTDALLDLLLVHRADLVSKVEIGGRLGQSDRKVIKFKISADRRKSSAKPQLWTWGEQTSGCSGNYRVKSPGKMFLQIFSKFGYVLKIIMFIKNNQFQALLQYADGMNAYYAKMSLDGQSIYPGCCTLRVGFSKLTSLKIKYNNDKSRDFTRIDLPFGDGQRPPDTSLTAAAFGTQNTILVPYTGATGFTQPLAFPQGAGVYGNVHRVKIMFKKRGIALVQMADATQAQLAINHLNGQRLYGRVMHTTLSKYQTIQLPREGQEDKGLTKDYSNSPLHRFKNPGSRNCQNIFPPSATLHLSNIPQKQYTYDNFNDNFNLKILNEMLYYRNQKYAAFGQIPYMFKVKKDCKMGLIQLGSVEEGVHALIELHNHDFGENQHLRVSFSKSTI